MFLKLTKLFLQQVELFLKLVELFSEQEVLFLKFWNCTEAPGIVSQPDEAALMPGGTDTEVLELYP
jgi:hypothetical protein